MFGNLRYFIKFYKIDEPNLFANGISKIIQTLLQVLSGCEQIKNSLIQNITSHPSMQSLTKQNTLKNYLEEIEKEEIF